MARKSDTTAKVAQATVEAAFEARAAASPVDEAADAAAGGTATAAAEARAEGAGAEEGEAAGEAKELLRKKAGADWFVIHTYSGYENKVKANLEKRVHSMNMGDKIFNVLVPMEEAIEIRDGRRRTVQRKIFPGYVLVEMVMTDDSWYVVRNTPGVTGFVGSGSKPTPLAEEEVRQILRQMGLLEEEAPRPKPKPRIDLEVGQNIRVRSGPFDGFIGVIDQIDVERGKLRVFVSMFGRETPLELDFTQVEKL